MNKLWKRWTRISRGKRLALDCALLLLLLWAAWAILNYPSLSAASAFRRGLADAGWTTPEMELLRQEHTDYSDYAYAKTLCYGLGADDTRSYLVYLDSDRGWHSEEVKSFPAAGDIGCVMLPSLYESDAYMRAWIEAEHYQRYEIQSEMCALRYAAFAVKAPGASAALTLVLEEREERNNPYLWAQSAGRFPLLFREVRDGWFFFDYDLSPLRNGLQVKWEDNTYGISYGWTLDEPAKSFYTWLNRCGEMRYDTRYDDFEKSAHLELTTYDESGNILQVAAWDLDTGERLDVEARGGTGT